MNPHTALLLVRPRPASAAIARLQVFASGATTLLACAVAMLTFAFWQVASTEAGYRILAIILVGVLVVPQRIQVFTGAVTEERLVELGRLLAVNLICPLIDSVTPFELAPEALASAATLHSRGKFVIVMGPRKEQLAKA